MSILLLAILFFTVALLYSSAGFGGGSSYIAILLLAGVSVVDTRFLALICNILVVSGSCYNFYKAGLLDVKKLTPLVLLSIPMSFLGGMISPDNQAYKILAAVTLIIAAVLMITPQISSNSEKKLSSLTLTGIGGGIGMLSGFIGIGGGIFLSPLLHLINWKDIRSISVASSFFILVNSFVGLLGQLTINPSLDLKTVFILGVCVIIGGQIGNRWNIHILKPEKIKLITALLIGFAGLVILIKQFN